MGLYYYNARYYDSELGRFIQADTEFATGAPDSQALNRYSYCINNPLVYTDPTGNFLGFDDIAVAMIVGAILSGTQAEMANAGGFMQGAAQGAASGLIGCASAGLGNALVAGGFGAIAGASAGGALSAAITGGDPAMGAAMAGISAGIGIRLGGVNPSMLTDTGKWFGELVVSTGVSSLVGGTMAEIQGGNFWSGASDGAIWGAAGYVLSSVLNTDDGQNPEDTFAFKAKKWFIECVAGCDVPDNAVNAALSSAGKGFAKGATDGVKANLGLVDGEYMSENYGLAGDISNWGRYTAEGAAYATGAAALWKQGGKLLAKKVAKSSIDDVAKAVGRTICFTAGTMVYAEDGMVPISKVKVGGHVWAYNFQTTKNELCKVINTFEQTTDSLIVLYAGEEVIEATPEHPFWVIGKGWTEAKLLAKGQELRNFNKDNIVVQGIQFEDRAETVYNFEVEGQHNYYITEIKVLVHNKCSLPGRGASGKDVVSFLKGSGFKHIRTKGSHYIMQGPKGVSVPVPVHGSKSLPVGTLKSILKQTGFAK